MLVRKVESRAFNSAEGVSLNMGRAPCFRLEGVVVRVRFWMYRRRRQGRQQCVMSSARDAIVASRRSRSFASALDVNQ